MSYACEIDGQMPSRSVPLSVRVSDDDAAFLAAFEAPGATTPSEKLRAILAAARRRHLGARDFTDCAVLIEDMLRPAERRLRDAQRQAGRRSDFVFKLYEHMPEIMAEMIAASPTTDDGIDGLKRFEVALADQVFAVIEEILDLGLTSRSRSYDPDLIKDRLSPVLEIVELLKIARDQSHGGAR